MLIKLMRTILFLTFVANFTEIGFSMIMTNANFGTVNVDSPALAAVGKQNYSVKGLLVTVFSSLIFSSFQYGIINSQGSSGHQFGDFGSVH